MMKGSLLLAAAAMAAASMAEPAAAREFRGQGGLANPNTQQILISHRTMRQQELLNEMRRLRGEVKAAKARNGGVLPEAERAMLETGSTR
jgi:Ni/Co efflux regulator RcnB